MVLSVEYSVLLKVLSVIHHRKNERRHNGKMSPKQHIRRQQAIIHPKMHNIFTAIGRSFIWFLKENSPSYIN
jgi:hypothetical protein